ncbi:hypothetical protein [Streptomyces sp. NPDC088752]|uniref:hypothetical protein n=1 Tax=Streptomyces sp. NPDC088752 TaxID=3154963 RepID=UPI003423E0AF
MARRSIIEITRKPTPRMVDAMRTGAARADGIIDVTADKRTHEGIVGRGMADWVPGYRLGRAGDLTSYCVLIKRGRDYLAKLDAANAPAAPQTAPEPVDTDAPGQQYGGITRADVANGNINIPAPALARAAAFFKMYDAQNPAPTGPQEDTTMSTDRQEIAAAVDNTPAIEPLHPKHFAHMIGTERTETRKVGPGEFVELRYRVTNIRFRGATQYRRACVIVSGRCIEGKPQEGHPNATWFGAYCAETFHSNPIPTPGIDANGRIVTPAADALTDWERDLVAVADTLPVVTGEPSADENAAQEDGDDAPGYTVETTTRVVSYRAEACAFEGEGDHECTDDCTWLDGDSRELESPSTAVDVADEYDLDMFDGDPVAWAVDLISKTDAIEPSVSPLGEELSASEWLSGSYTDPHQGDSRVTETTVRLTDGWTDVQRARVFAEVVAKLRGH